MIFPVYDIYVMYICQGVIKLKAALLLVQANTLNEKTTVLMHILIEIYKVFHQITVPGF